MDEVFPGCGLDDLIVIPQQPVQLLPETVILLDNKDRSLHFDTSRKQ